MDKEQQYIQLREKLHKMGFQGGGLDAGLKMNLDLGLPFFTLSHELEYERERMRFELGYSWDKEQDSYRLEQCKATHRREIDIYQENVNGVNIYELETAMADIDWPGYFADPASDLSVYHKEYIKSTLDTLRELAKGPSEYGHELMELLMYKYWPSQVVQLSFLTKFQEEYEHTRQFRIEDWPVFTADLAFHIVSERFSMVYNGIAETGIEVITGIDLNPWLEQQLSVSPPEGFQSVQTWGTKEGHATMTINIDKSEGNYFVDGFKLSFASYPEIEHGIYNGVHTRVLEAHMQEINWKRKEDLLTDESVLKQSVIEVVAKTQRLAQTAEGAVVRDLLALKYWQQSTLFRDAIPQSAWDRLATLPVRTQEFLPGATAEAAANFMAGRAVSEQVIYPMAGKSNTWLRLEPGTGADPNGTIIRIEGYSRDELGELIRLLPLRSCNTYILCNSLMNGDLTPAVLTNGTKLLLEADPEARTIKVFTPEMRPIHINLRFDPDWKPPEEILQSRTGQKPTYGLETGKKHSQKEKPKGRKL